jgi:ABC-type phosphonate transport system ATPase subunit
VLWYVNPTDPLYVFGPSGSGKTSALKQLAAKLNYPVFEVTGHTVLDHLVVVHLDIAIWTARKKLAATDLGGAELPPEDLASLGSKRICNPEDLRTFGTLKARAVSLLDRNGVRFLNGWAIPESC